MKKTFLSGLISLVITVAIFAQNYRLDAIRVAEQTPCKVRFQVQYYINPAISEPCYIGAYIPNQAAMASFALNPAGRAPNGIPKEQKNFSDNISFEMSWTGTNPYTSQTIEVVIDNRSGNLISRTFNFTKSWSRFEIQGIKRIETRPNLVKFQVQYFIDPEYAPACYLGATVPNRSSASTAFGYRPAGRAPNGVPKGQIYFHNNIVVELSYHGANPYNSTTLEVSIYTENNNLFGQIINWGQTWHR